MAATPRDPAPQPPPSVWDGIRRVVRLSALSASLLLHPSVAPFSLSASHAAPSSSTPATATATSSSTSDVEAAAVTLGAVTLGGVVMRAIVNGSRNDKERESKLQAECKRLADEERVRALRAERAKLESLDDDDDDDDDESQDGRMRYSPSSSSTAYERHRAADVDAGADVKPVSDADLMSELRKRLQSMDGDDESDDENGGADSGSEGGDDGDDGDDNMRHKPIPDRGTGSALLERPDGDDGNGRGVGGNSSGTTDGVKAEGGSDEAIGDDPEVNADDLEKLKRMWNLSPPDKE